MKKVNIIKSYNALTPISSPICRRYIFPSFAKNKTSLNTETKDSLSFSKTGKSSAIHEYKENIYPYLLRNARARWLLYNGYSMYYVKRFLRHKKISTTLTYMGNMMMKNL